MFVIYIIVQVLSYQLLSFDRRSFLDQTVIWISFLIYLAIYFFQLSSSKFSPTLVNFLKRELSNIDFEIQKKYKTGINFFLFTSFTIIIFVFVNILIYFPSNDFTTSLAIRLITIYIFSSILIPILRGILHDKFFVKLKTPYYVQIDLQFRLIKHKEVESKMIRIYMTSNKLCLKSNQLEFNLHKEISEKRWLPIKRRLISPTLQRRSYLYFHEYSTLINFKENFLNIVSAIREWDISHESMIKKDSIT